MHTSLRIVAVLALAISLLLPAQSASATGLVAFDEAGRAVELGSLRSLDVDVRLTQTQAIVRQTRHYGIEVREGEELRFYQTLSVATHDAPVITAQGRRVSALVADGGYPDARRRQLLRELREPGVIRGTSQPLAESARFRTEAEGYNTVEITTMHVEDLSRWDTMQGLQLPIDWQEPAVNSVSATVTAQTDEPLAALYSPFHALNVVREGATSATATYNGYQVCTTNDLLLLLSTSTDPVHLDVLPFRYGQEEGGFFVGLLTPQASGEALPRDLVFVVDSSGSMEGEKMSQAQEALRNVVAELSPKDRFTIVDFDGVVRVLEGEAQTASRDFVTSATQFIDDLSADGATNLYAALETGFDALPYDADRPRYIVVLTDGQPTEGETDTEAIVDLMNRRNEVGARVFTFGIGYDVNTVLLDRLAAESSGDAIYIRPGESVVGPVQEFFAQIASAALVDPVISSASFGGLTARYPESLPDLFANQTTAIVGRYGVGGAGEVVIQGRRGSELVTHTFEVDLPEHAVRNGFAPRVWATRHIGTLLQRIKLGDADPAIPIEAVSIASRFGVVTEFTNFALDEDGNAVMRYTDVPLDVTGSVAVDTSSSLDGYQNTGSAFVQFDDLVRVAMDRTLPTTDGRYIDTSAHDADWYDIHFGSALYFDVLNERAEHGFARLLSVASDVGFEWHGQHIRVTDVSNPVHDAAPSEVGTIPVALVPPQTHANVVLVEQTFDAAPPRPGAPGDRGEEGADYVEGNALGGGGCSVAASGTSGPLTFVILALVGLRRRRR